MDIWNALTALGSQLMQWLSASADKWLAYIVHPGGWAWFVCAVVTAIWICSRFILRPLSKHIAIQVENQTQTLK